MTTSAPSIAIVDPSEERRLTLAQIIAIRWPDAVVEDFSSLELSSAELVPMLSRYAALITHVDKLPGLRYLKALLALPTCPGVIAVSDHDPTLHQAMNLGATTWLNEQSLSRLTVETALREAMMVTESRRRMFEATQPLNVARPMEKTALVIPKIQSNAPETDDFLADIRGYKILEKIGEGGMSRVYLADDTRTAQRLVLKVFDAEPARDERELVLFLKEYAIVSEIDSQFVVRIFDHGVTDHHAFIAMEHLPGGDLKDRLKQRIEPKQSTAIMSQIARALDAIHRAGIVHRDLKPQNVMFRRMDSLVLVDFGISKLSGATTVMQSASLGTPAYISPEQVRGEPPDARSDLYSAGAIFYELLTSKRPFYGRDVAELLNKHIEEPAPPLPANLSMYQDVMDRLLAKRPEERFASAGELLQHLRRRWPEAVV